MTMYERQPLLEGLDSNAQEARTPSGNSRWRFLPEIQVTEPRFRFLPLVGCLIILVNDVEYYFKEVGYFRALEALYCIEYYQEVDPKIAALGRGIPESMCKYGPIEKKVSTANGIVMLTRMVSSLIGTMPLGYLSDRLGRRSALVMHKVGTSLYTLIILVTYIGYPKIPIWVSFLGGLSGLIGANIDLNLAVMLASYTDVMISPSQRSTAYFVTSSMQFVAQLGSPVAAGAATNIDGKGGTPEVSLALSFALAVTGLLVSFFLWPETLDKTQRLRTRSGPRDDDEQSGKTTYTDLISEKARSVWNNLQRSAEGVGVTSLLLLAMSILLVSTAIKSIDWLGLIQYPVIRFDWQYKQSTFIMTIQAAVYVFTYFVLLPSSNRLGSHLGYNPSATALFIMLACIAFLEAGSILMGFSTTPEQFIGAVCLFALGAGLPSVIQTYIANLVDNNSVGKLLAVVSLFQVGGKACATGVGPAIINAGIDSDDDRLKGSIFFFAAAVFVLAGLALSLVAVIARLSRQYSEIRCDEGRGRDQD